MSKNSFGYTAVAAPARSGSKLIPATEAQAAEALQPEAESDAPPSLPSKRSMRSDIAMAIEREAARDPSDPFLAGRLAAHYRQGIWTPTAIAAGEKKK